ncbi:MAG: PfkB family carbohydrate kinase [Anaerolineae bacterium]
MSIDFLVIGHITHDRAPEGFRLGGTVSFAAVTALRLGLRPGIITRGSAEGLRNGETQVDGLLTPAVGPLAGVPIRLLPSSVSTTFVNIYQGGQRTQLIEALAEPITPDALPDGWTAAPIVLLGPIAREVPAEWTARFPTALLGVTPQGWLRAWDAAGRVHPSRWENAGPFLERADVIILSREDVGGDDRYIAELAGQARLLVVTDGWHGATLYLAGRPHPIPPRPAVEVDPTGAGDVFATAFLVRLYETRDPLIAARFANIVASMSVEAPGMDSIPWRAQAEAWLEKNG